jgi:catechol 2,3-dioxygenase-like lactoylglutathione lyase family enzyme
MKPHVAVVTLGVRDLARARRFYSEGLGWPIQQEDHNWVCFLLGDGPCALALYPWEELAEDAKVPAEGGGFRGVTLAHTYVQRSTSRRFLSRRNAPAARSSSPRSAPSGEATAATSPTPRATCGRSRPGATQLPFSE